jgi:hypothetical protein
MLEIPSTEERLGGSPQRVLRYFVLLMSLVYMALGVWLWVTSSYPSAAGALLPLSITARRVLGTLFIGYGLLRFVRSYRQYFRKRPARHEPFN